MERTLIIIKPDAVQRGLIGQVTDRFEKKGLKLVGMKMVRLSEEVLLEHYAHIADKPFFPGVKSFMTSAPVILQCWEGVNVVDTVRLVTGVTNAREAQPGSIRGDYAMSLQSNILHASDSIESAETEVARFFASEELVDWKMAKEDFLYADNEKA